MKKQPKKPYSTPVLTHYGTLTEMTTGSGHAGKRDNAHTGHKS